LYQPVAFGILSANTESLLRQMLLEGTPMFTIIMIVAVVGLAIAWAIYGYYEYKARQEEKKQPKQVSERLQKSRSEVVDWARKLAEYKPPVPKKPAEQDQSESRG
jgi:uncharacterized membrane protein YciS (DUF1049 family)